MTSDGSSHGSVPSALARLRSDLVFIEKYERGRPTGQFLLKDPGTDEVWEFGPEEKFLCEQLDGESSFEVIRARYERHFGSPLPIDQLESFVNQLDFEELLVHSVAEQEWIQYWDPEEAFIPTHRYPLFDPDPFLTWLHPHVRWIFTPAFVVASLLTIALGLFFLVYHWTVLLDDMYAIWTPKYFLLLIPVGVGITQVIHEFAHGIVCKHYGGQVKEGGIILVYHFIFKFYLRRSQTMLIAQKEMYKKCLVPLAGLWCQWLLAAIGIIAVVCVVDHDGYAHYFWTALWSTAAWGSFHNMNISHRRDAHF